MSLLEEVQGLIKSCRDDMKFRDTSTYRRRRAAERGHRKYGASYKIAARRKERQMD
jgi:hypothetical protein